MTLPMAIALGSYNNHIPLPQVWELWLLGVFPAGLEPGAPCLVEEALEQAFSLSEL